MKISCPSAVALATFVSSTAFALEPGVTGRGFPLGEKSRLHTKVDLGVGYDTNPNRLTEQEIGTQEVGDAKLTVRPGLSVEVPGSSFSFGLDTQVTVEQYFGTGSTAADTEVGGNVGLNMTLGSPDSVVGFVLRDTLTRTPTYFNEIGTVGALEIKYPNWHNRGEADLLLRPGGGALQFTVGYTNEVTIFNGSDFADLPDTQRHGMLLEAKLKFLPKTAAIFAAEASFFSTNEDQSIANATNRSTPYSVSLGLQGQLTARLSTVLRVGFGDTLVWENGFFDTSSDDTQRTVIGQATFTYAITDGTDVSLGYERRVQPVIFLNSYVSDTGTFRTAIAIGDRLAIQGFASLEYRNFADQGTIEPGALVVTGDVRLEYWFFDFLNAAASYRVIYQNGDPDNTISGGASDALLEDYTRHIALLEVGLRY